MKTVAVVCEKGGVGKTMLAQELFFYFQRKGVPTSLYSLDPQYANRTQRTENAEVAIVDTPGASNSRVEEVIKGADVVLVPVRPSPGVDLQPFLRTVGKVTEAKVPLIVCVNCWNRYKVAAAFREWFEKKPWAKELFLIPQSEAIVQAQMQECSVLDINQYTKASVAIVELCDRISNIIGV